MSYWKVLLIASALFGLYGAGMGAHMAGAGSPSLRPIHAHVLVLGWLSLFAWSVFYKVYRPKQKWLSRIHVVSAIAGSFLLTFGMWLYFESPFNLSEGITLAAYIIGGVFVVVSFFTFVVQAILLEDEKKSLQS
ncbi:hypothetical protein DH09_05570 [Bacillaceae bacterium JMAK1]|nr:hypothetical protein DH09_05570 [Bacillaceae bacterium JMAK1]